MFAEHSALAAGATFLRTIRKDWKNERLNCVCQKCGRFIVVAVAASMRCNLLNTKIQNYYLLCLDHKQNLLSLYFAHSLTPRYLS